MPIKSKKQYGFMQMMAHGKSSSKGLGSPGKEVAKEMIHKTPGKDRSMFAKTLNKKKKIK